MNAEEELDKNWHRGKHLRMGVYKHYKGPLYQVVGLAHDANDPERTCVVYFPLQLDGSHLGPRIAVRTLEDFLGWEEDEAAPQMMFSDGTVKGAWRRFTYLGPDLQEGMRK